LEHIPNYLFALGEIHRVLKHDGELFLSLPYATLTEYHLVNPYHHHNFTDGSFDFFDPLLLKGSAAEDGELTFRKALVRFSYIGWWGMAPRPIRVWARKHLLNIVRQFDIALVAIKDPDRPVDVGKARARELEERLVELKRKRAPYPDVNSGSQAERPAAASGNRAVSLAAARGSVRWRTQAIRRRGETRHE
jgi:hypothetical protein